MNNDDTCPICGEQLWLSQCGYDDYGSGRWYCHTHDLWMTVYPSDEED